MLIDILRACVIDSKGSWVDYLPLIEFSYNHSYDSSIQMAPFEAIYGRRCSSLIGWFKVSEVSVIGPNLVFNALEKVQLIRERLRLLKADRSDMLMFVERISILRSMIMSI